MSELLKGKFRKGCLSKERSDHFDNMSFKGRSDCSDAYTHLVMAYMGKMKMEADGSLKEANAWYDHIFMEQRND